ncbi:hypothetical protein OH76DRAFT_1525959, partial [Lentinus brumalis]
MHAPSREVAGNRRQENMSRTVEKIPCHFKRHVPLIALLPPPNHLYSPTTRLSSASEYPNGYPEAPIAVTLAQDELQLKDAVLELADGTAFRGISFGAEGKSVAGECVFQMGMVGYTESLTDPSYEGQILVLTYPFIGNYGVPPRPEAASVDDIPPEFESSRIHVAAVVVGSYSEDYSHFLAGSSLGQWLKECGVPAIYGVDTRSTRSSVIAATTASRSATWRYNFNPLGIHTGDSIVVAPSQTISDADYNMLRTTAINVIRNLGVVGECNIQYALNSTSREYCIIEVNARLSHSSALASKATGYPLAFIAATGYPLAFIAATGCSLAFIAAKLGLGIPLNEIKNSVTKVTSACFEPSLDYVVVKIPRWDLKKFDRVSRLLSRVLETFQKAIRAIDDQSSGFSKNDFVEDIDEELINPTDKRIFATATAFHRGYSIDKIWQITSAWRPSSTSTTPNGPRGVIISIGGQTPNNIALPLYRQNVKIYRTSPEMFDTTNSFKFSRSLDEIGADQPLRKELLNSDEAHTLCEKVGYPVPVRPAQDDPNSYVSQATALSCDYLVVITKYLE